jgi:hypothetical protein
MRTTILRRLEALEKEQRSYEQKERSSLEEALMYIWIIVLAYYLGDLQPKNDDPFDAFNRVLKFPADPDLMPISDLNYLNRLKDAYRRFFASRSLDPDEAPLTALFDAFVVSVNQLPDQWLKWLRDNLRAYCSNAMIAPRSNLPRQVSYDNFFFKG